MKTQLPPELVEKYRKYYVCGTIEAEYGAQIAVEYSWDRSMQLSIENERLKAERDELLSAMREFTNAIESEEITIQENCDNDGWENCGGRLYETFKKLINKIDGK